MKENLYKRLPPLERRLGDVEVHGGFREIQAFRQFHKVPQLTGMDVQTDRSLLPQQLTINDISYGIL